MPTTTSHLLPYPAPSDPADVPADIAALAEAVDSKLDDIAPAQITGATSGQLFIANSSGVVTAVALTGDVTVSNTGATTIGASAVTTNKLDNDAVSTAKIVNSAVTTAKINNGAVTAAKIGDGQIITDKIASGQVTTDKIPNFAVNSSKIADGSVTTAKIGDSQVTTAKVNSGAVTADKIGTNAVTSTELRDDASTDSNRAVTTNHLRNSAVTTDKLNNVAVTTAKIADSAVTSAKIADGTIANADIASNAAIAESKLSLASDAAAATASRRTLGTGATQACAGNDSRLSNSRTPTGTAGGSLSGTFPNPGIATNAVDTAQITNGAVTTAKIGDSQVTTAKINNSAVTTDKLNNGAVTNAKLNLSSSTGSGTGTSANNVEEVAVDTPSLGAGTYLVLFNGYVDFPETVTTCNVRLKRGSTQITLFNPRVPGTSNNTRVVLPLSFGELVTLTTSQVISVTVQAPTTGFGSTVGGSLTVLKIA